jgi:hypothetical protein
MSGRPRRESIVRSIDEMKFQSQKRPQKCAESFSPLEASPKKVQFSEGKFRNFSCLDRSFPENVERGRERTMCETSS